MVADLDAISKDLCAKIKQLARQRHLCRNGPGQGGATTWGGVLVLNPPNAGPKKIEASSITDNKAVGVACTGAVAANGVLVSGNGSVEVATACGFMSCGVAGPMCGAPF